MNRRTATQRRAYKRELATAWFRDHYPALKVAARLSGTYYAWMFKEFEALPLLVRYQKRQLLHRWMRYHELFSPGMCACINHDWLGWGHMARLTSEIARKEKLNGNT